MTSPGDDRAQAAAAFLIAARRSEPGPALPEALRPASEAEAYAIQDAVAAEFGPVAGWKVGAATPEAEPACAPLLAGTLFESPATFDRARHPRRGIEAEIAFRIGQDLPARSRPYDRDEVLATIDCAFPAIELCESRYRDPDTVDPLSMQADNNQNAALVFGTPWRDFAGLVIDRQPVALLFDDKAVVEGMGGNTAGDLFRLVVWLANHLPGRGQALTRGQIVTTGSWTGIRFAGDTRNVTARFPGIGDCMLDFS